MTVFRRVLKHVSLPSQNLCQPTSPSKLSSPLKIVHDYPTAGTSLDICRTTLGVKFTTAEVGRRIGFYTQRLCLHNGHGSGLLQTTPDRQSSVES